MIFIQFSLCKQWGEYIFIAQECLPIQGNVNKSYDSSQIFILKNLALEDFLGNCDKLIIDMSIYKEDAFTVK